jgi:hypothetical protein
MTQSNPELLASPGEPAPGVRVFGPSHGSARGLAALAASHLGLGIVLVWTSLANSDGSDARPVSSAVLCGVVFGTLAVLMVLAALASRRTRLTTTPTSVLLTGLGRPQVALLPEVTRAVWRGRPTGGSVLLHSPTGRMFLAFPTFKNGGELRAWLQNALPAGVQEAERGAHGRRSDRPPVPVVVDGAKLLALSVANAIVVGVACVPWEPPRVALVAVLLTGVCCPAVPMLATVDAVRRPSRWSVAAAVVGLVALAVLGAKGWVLYHAMRVGLV